MEKELSVLSVDVNECTRMESSARVWEKCGGTYAGTSARKATPLLSQFSIVWHIQFWSNANLSSFSFEPAFDAQLFDCYGDWFRFVGLVLAVLVQIKHGRF